MFSNASWTFTRILLNTLYVVHFSQSQCCSLIRSLRSVGTRFYGRHMKLLPNCCNIREKEENLLSAHAEIESQIYIAARGLSWFDDGKIAFMMSLRTRWCVMENNYHLVFRQQISPRSLPEGARTVRKRLQINISGVQQTRITYAWGIKNWCVSAPGEN